MYKSTFTPHPERQCHETALMSNPKTACQNTTHLQNAKKREVQFPSFDAIQSHHMLQALHINRSS
jgi:hypothetical protein